MQKYMIYESAITPEISNIKRSAKGVEFITVLQEADAKNRNGRIYPKIVLDHALKSPIIQEHINIKHDWFGEVGHPFTNDLARQTQIDLNNIAFRINEFWWEGNLLKGRLETLNNSRGRDMAALIEQGCLVSFSLRAQGNVVRDPVRDALVVQEPLMIVTFDWVALPSHQNAYMSEICEETKTAMFSPMMSLAESFNLYENGSMVELNKSADKEKITKDYVTPYSSKYKTLNEVYVYDPNDKIVSSNKEYILLENDECFKKVPTQDYLLKSLRADIKESVAGIALADVPESTEIIKPLVPEDKPETETNIDSVVTPQEVGTDVSMEYENPMQAEVRKTLGDDAKNVSASLKEEFVNFYTIIREETGLTNDDDILKFGLKYTEFMSEDCANLFRTIEEN